MRSDRPVPRGDIFQGRDENVTEISWDEFFRTFEENDLALRLPDDQDSRFNKFVARDQG